MDVAVLGGGMIGVSAAIHLAKRGRSVVLVDRNPSCVEASYGNGGLIQSEGVLPYGFPRSIGTLAGIASNRSSAVRYDPLFLMKHAGSLARYWWHSAPERYARIVKESEPLIAGAASAHAELTKAAGAEDFVKREGWIRLFRSEPTMLKAFAEADLMKNEHNIPHRKLSPQDLYGLEPDLGAGIAGAIHWHASATVNDPGGLVDAYRELFKSLGGVLATLNVSRLEEIDDGWICHAADAPSVRARELVVAAGPSTARFAGQLGYNLPLFVKRGYHRHYQPSPEIRLNRPVLDTDGGFLIAPMKRGIRLTTGVEFASENSRQNEAQVEQVEPVARQLLDFGGRVESKPWMGMRVCTPDMKPIIGAAPRHRRLWFCAGHAHRGFTLGPMSGQLLADEMTGATPAIDIAPFSMGRFRLI